eukprot:Unigene16143_Nuclearia_a/m.47953 Unigene16143_Nuclearia_a/g.47953  ORF Unigene16143_Nuclearia_a/g.47953 Unigene16143_Nuclearia_a/m.47953 type:complete len:402 (-) Unigene16143_Nuclearia_a:33-1238(-)
MRLVVVRPAPWLVEPALAPEQVLLHVRAPLAVARVRLHERQVVKARVERVGLRARVRDKPAVVQVLGRLHRPVGRHAQLGRAQLLQLDRRQRQRPPPRHVLGHDRRHARLGQRVPALLVQQRPKRLVVHAPALPRHRQRRPILLQVQVQVPERLGHKVLRPEVPLDDEAQRRELARPVAERALDERVEPGLQQHRLEAREGRADAQVELGACVDRVRQAPVGRGERGEGATDLGGANGREVGAAHAQMAVAARARLDDLKADVLALAVAVGPQQQLVAPTRLALEVARDQVHLVAHEHLDRRRKQLKRRAVGPAPEARAKVAVEQMPQHRRHRHLAPHAVKLAAEVEAAVVLGHALARAHVLRPAREDRRHLLGDRRLLGHAQHARHRRGRRTKRVARRSR